MKVLDTNILLDNMDCEGIVLYGVLMELDRQKTSDGERGYKARRAIRNIEKSDCLKKVYFELEKDEKVDDYLVRYCLEHNCVLATRDLSLALKAEVKGCAVDFVKQDVEADYDPTVYINQEEEMAAFYEGNFEGLKNSSYVVLADSEIYKIKNNKPQRVNRKQIENDWTGRIIARNIEQEILIDSLYDNNFKVIVGSGGFGAGELNCPFI